MHRNVTTVFKTLIPATLALLAACASTPPPEPEEQGGPYWSYSRVVDTDQTMITLFDPVDLEHHVVDPADWYEYDFAFLEDLAAGRFAAVITGSNGLNTVRVTNAPLSDKELAVAGPDAELRLRVLNDRLLLSDGSAWPSEQRSLQSVLRSADRKNWLTVPNGDYRLTVTALDASAADVHDYVFQLDAIAGIDEVPHAPGIPQLVPGAKVAGVAGVNASGVSFNERCAAVPRKAELSPLVAHRYPLPGAYGDVEISSALSERGRGLQNAGERADLPLVVARNAAVGSFGVYVQPHRWMGDTTDNWGRPVSVVRGRALCAVRITAVESGNAGFVLTVNPLPGARDRLPHGLARELVQRFEQHLRVSSDPAYRFKSAYVQRARDYRSLVLGVMQYLKLSSTQMEELLQMDNQSRAYRLIDLMS